MNKFGKIVSLALSATIALSAFAMPVLANDTDVAELNDNEITLTAKDDFSIEQYPYSFTKTLDDDDELRDHILYNESSKFKNALSTRTSNPGIGFGPGVNGNAMILNFYSGHREDKYGGQEKESSYGNAAQLSFTTKNETVHADPTTGATIGLTLSEATVGVNKVAFWTMASKVDRTDRVAPETVTYSISFRNCGASGVTVKIPADGQWHYVVADLATPFGTGCDGINVSGSNSGVFGSANGGAPVLKLDGKADAYPLDKDDVHIKDIDEAYVLVDGEYVRVKAESFEYEADPEGIYVNIPDGEGNPVYHRTDSRRYVFTKDENGGNVYLETADGDYILNTKTGAYVQMPDPEANFADKYSLINVESYIVDENGEKVLDEEGNPIPQAICGNLVKELWQTQICIDDMLFYRTTESGKRTSFIPSSEEDLAYYANTDLDSVYYDGSVIYDIDTDADKRVISLPKGFDLTAEDAESHFSVTTKCPDVIFTGEKDGSAFVPIDISESGTMKSGSIGKITLPDNINGKAIVSVISSQGTMQDYEFDLKWGLELTATGKDRTDRNGRPLKLFEKISSGLRDIEITNYGEETKHVQIMLVVRDRDTNELKIVALDQSKGGQDIAPGQTVGFKVNIPSGLGDVSNCIAYFYCFDSVTGMNKVAPTVIIDPSLYN